MTKDTSTPAPARTPADAVMCTGCNRIMWKDDVDANGRCGDAGCQSPAPIATDTTSADAPAQTTTVPTARKARA